MGTYFAHETAVVDRGAEIGEGTKIWHFTHISSTARIGKNCTLGQNVYVGPGVVIGDNCKIQNNVSVYEGVTLDDNVFVGPSVVFTNTFYPKIGVTPEYQNTHIKRGASLGANCTIVCGREGVVVGEDAFVGAGAVVTQNVTAGAVVYGVPARSKEK